MINNAQNVHVEHVASVSDKMAADGGFSSGWYGTPARLSDLGAAMRVGVNTPRSLGDEFAPKTASKRNSP